MKIFATLSLLLLFIAQPASAVVVSSLYTGTVSTPNYSSPNSSQLVSNALEQVLIKVSGNPRIATMPKIHSALTNADSLVDSYSYDDTHQTFTAHFTPATIKQLLTNAKQPIWGQNRPEIIMWLTLTPFNSPTTIVASSDTSIVPLLKTAAENRGLPILFPQPDSTNPATVTPIDIEQMKLTPITNASQRYHSSTLLLGSLAQTSDGNWQGQWQLVYTGNSIAWQTANQPLAQSINAIIDNVAVELATSLATPDDGALSQTFTIQVFGAHDLQTDLDLIQHIESLNTVSKVSLVEVTPQSISLQVTGNSTKEAIQRHIQQRFDLAPSIPQPLTSNHDATTTNAQS